MHIERNDAIARIKTALRAKTGKAWSVRGQAGTAWGWIDVLPMPKDQPKKEQMTAEQAAELAHAFGLSEVHYQGLSIPPDERAEYVARAERDMPAQVYAPKARKAHAASRAAFAQGRVSEAHSPFCGCSDCPL